MGIIFHKQVYVNHIYANASEVAQKLTLAFCVPSKLSTISQFCVRVVQIFCGPNILVDLNCQPDVVLLTHRMSKFIPK